MTSTETLQGMRDLLIDPAHWTTGSRARNARGEYVKPTSGRAACWCLVGSFQKVTDTTCEQDVYGTFASDPAGVCLQEAVDQHGRFPNVWSFNDRTSHSEVIALLDTALVNSKKDTDDLHTA